MGREPNARLHWEGNRLGGKALMGDGILPHQLHYLNLIPDQVSGQVRATPHLSREKKGHLHPCHKGSDPMRSPQGLHPCR